MRSPGFKSHAQHNRKLRVAIDCRITNPHQGIGTAILSLAHALSESTITDQEYVFIVRDELHEWLKANIYGPCSIEVISNSPSAAIDRAKNYLRLISPLRKLRNKLPIQVPASDGFIESLDCDIVHFPTQLGYSTSLPSIYQPWDLQHLHYPDFFTKTEFARREKLYRAFCEQATFVCVQTEWSKNDIVEHYGVSPDKVVVIPWGCVYEAYQPVSATVLDATREKYGLPREFYFYPAATWPHKNHEVIIRALQILRNEYNFSPRVYFTGSITEYRSILEALARELGVSSQLHYLGFVTPEELQSICSSATAMIFASKFEGFGLPIIEAFQARVPVICSNATVLPEVASDGALYFDPSSPSQLAKLMMQIIDQPELRGSLTSKGTELLSRYSMKETAANFQKLYQSVTRTLINDSDSTTPAILDRATL